MNNGTRADHNQFCLNEAWTLVRDAQGRAVRHHVTYELALPKGDVLRTRISRPISKETYGPDLWKTILREQLQVSEVEFWACVSDGIIPDRGTAPATPSNALPAQLVYQLIHTAGIPADQVADMSLDQATATMNEFWSRPPG